VRVSCRIYDEVCRILIRVKFDQLRAGTLLPYLVEPNVSKDGVQPRLYITVFAQPLHRLYCVNVGFLYQVLALEEVPSERHRVSEQSVGMVEWGHRRFLRFAFLRCAIRE